MVSSATIATLVKMIESLPASAQEQVVEHLREYLPDLQDELRWDELYQRTQHGLVEAARKARHEKAAGQAAQLDLDRL
jgi:hypothetical protein